MVTGSARHVVEVSQMPFGEGLVLLALGVTLLGLLLMRRRAGVEHHRAVYVARHDPSHRRHLTRRD